MYVIPAARPVSVTHDAVAGTLTVVWVRGSHALQGVSLVASHVSSHLSQGPGGSCWRETWGVRNGVLTLLSREPGVHRVTYMVPEAFLFPGDEGCPDHVEGTPWDPFGSFSSRIEPS
jgi:hypothetical protein